MRNLMIVCALCSYVDLFLMACSRSLLDVLALAVMAGVFFVLGQRCRQVDAHVQRLHEIMEVDRMQARIQAELDWFDEAIGAAQRTDQGGGATVNVDIR